MQHEVDVAGRRRRLDLYYPGSKVAVEYDGEHHFSNEWQLSEDAVRLDALTRDGWIVVRVVARDLYREPELVINRVAAALRQRGEAVHLSNVWREHFPTHLALVA